jgi:Fe-S-cluster containining protein
MGFVSIRHPRFVRVERAIFVRKIVEDCLEHRCHMHAAGSEKLDACCQYGADTDVHERDRVLARADEIGALLEPAARDAPWFTPSPEPDPDFPSGMLVRTQTFAQGCVFLAHDQRGCAIHRAAIEGGWDFRGTKPHVCRLFPLTYDSDSIMVSDDLVDYSCAYEADAPTLYRNQRDVLADVFGEELVVALDEAEAEVLRSERRRLPVVRAASAHDLS